MATGHATNGHAANGYAMVGGYAMAGTARDMPSDADDRPAGPTGDDQPVVELVDVVSAVGDFPVLAGIDLRVCAGEIVLIHGENGAGKTSLLRLCAGFLPVSRGVATVCGFNVATAPRSVGQSVGLLGHRNGLYGELTAAENLAFWSRAVGASTADATAALERVGISGRVANVPARSLSAGQRRRTALAALIVRRARLWLLDEPHAGLDAAARDELDQILVQAAAAGATVMMASHELERAERLSPRAITIRAGRVIADSSPVSSPGASAVNPPSPQQGDGDV